MLCCACCAAPCCASPCLKSSCMDCAENAALGQTVAAPASAIRPGTSWRHVLSSPGQAQRWGRTAWPKALPAAAGFLVWGSELLPQGRCGRHLPPVSRAPSPLLLPVPPHCVPGAGSSGRAPGVGGCGGAGGAGLLQHRPHVLPHHSSSSSSSSSSRRQLASSSLASSCKGVPVAANGLL